MLRGVDTTRLLIVPTCQHAAMDLVQTGEKVDVEKDLLLEKVCVYKGQRVCPCLRVRVRSTVGSCIHTTVGPPSLPQRPTTTRPLWRSSLHGRARWPARWRPRVTGRTSSTPAPACRCVCVVAGWGRGEGLPGVKAVG